MESIIQVFPDEYHLGGVPCLHLIIFYRKKFLIENFISKKMVEKIARFRRAFDSI